MNRTVRIALLACGLQACASTSPTVLEDARRDFSSRAGESPPWDRTVADLRRDALADGTLSVEGATRLALISNPRLAAMLQELGIARGELVQATLPANPVLDAEARFKEGGQGAIIEFAVVQNVLDLLFLPRRRQVAEARLEAAQAEATGAFIDLVAAVRTAYRDLQAELELTTLFRTALDTAYYSYDLSKRLREAGNVIELNVLNDQVLYEEMKLALVRSRASVAQGRENLNMLLGLSGEDADAWELNPRVPEAEPFALDGAQVERDAVEASLDLLRQASELEALGHEVGLHRLEEIFGTGSLGAIGEREDDGGWLAGPLASVSLPFWNFGQGASMKARARFRKHFEMFTDSARRVRRGARSLLVAANTSERNAAYIREVILPLRSSVTRATQLQFNAMQVGAFQLLDAKRHEIATARDYVETLRTHWRARIRLESMLMGRMPQGGYSLDTISIAASGGSSQMSSQGGH